MVSEAEIIIAFLFKRSGKEELSLSEFYLTLSMDLKWYTPKEAKDFVKQALQDNLLTKKGESVKTSFDYKKIVVPVGFLPTKKIVKEKEEKLEESLDVIEKIINHIVEKTGESKQNIVKKIKEVEEEKNIVSEVAALLVGKEYNIDVEDFFE